jgi:hypothetical protein
MLDRAKALAARAIEHIKQKSLRYWVSATLVFLATFFGSERAYNLLSLGDLRARYFQLLMDHPGAPVPGYVSIALIDDKEYWSGPPDGRLPLKRDYLARVVDALVAANASVIALDVDTLLPDPESLQIPEEYKGETCKLIKAIKRGAAGGTSFVLASSVSFDAHRNYRVDTDAYQANGLCERPNRAASAEKPCGEDTAFSAEEKERVTCGYIILPYDILEIPGEIDVVGGGKLPSFGLAVARAGRSNRVAEALWHSDSAVRYGNYISERGFEQANARFSTVNLLAEPLHLRNRNDAVIVGAGWREFAMNRGPRTDLHRTTLGLMPGALVHANFAEAILGSRAAMAAPSWVARTLEAIFSLTAALLLAFVPGFWGKTCALLGLLVMLFAVQWAVLHGLAVFFDAFLPVLGLGLHALYERILGMHEAAAAKS